jgi:hypothetical protein
MILSTAHKKAMMKAFEIPKMDSTIRYKINTIPSWSSKPIK